MVLKSMIGWQANKYNQMHAVTFSLKYLFKQMLHSYTCVVHKLSIKSVIIESDHILTTKRGFLEMMQDYPILQ